jgi:hypothetical protein
MSNLRHLLPALVVTLAFSHALSANSIAQNAPAYAVLEGTVFDMSREAIVLDQKVVIENLQTRQVWRLATDETVGTFRATVPPGTYSLSTEETHWNLPFRRAAFRLEAGSISTVNIVLSPRILSIALNIVKGYEIERAPAQRYESFSIPAASSDLLKLLIQYQTKQTSKGTTVYKWAKVSFDLVTVYADEIKLHRKTRRFIASGRVMVEDGKERRKLSTASIHFKDGKLIIEPESQPKA